MTIFETLADLNARLAKIEGAGSVDTSSFATHDEVTAVADRVTVLESEVGTPPEQAA